MSSSDISEGLLQNNNQQQNQQANSTGNSPTKTSPNSSNHHNNQNSSFITSSSTQEQQQERKPVVETSEAYDEDFSNSNRSFVNKPQPTIPGLAGYSLNNGDNSPVYKSSPIIQMDQESDALIAGGPEENNNNNGERRKALADGGGGGAIVVGVGDEDPDKIRAAATHKATSLPGRILELFNRFFMAFPVQIVMVLLTLIDIIFLIYEFATNQTRYEILTMFTSTSFMFEVLAGLGHLQSNYFLFEKAWVVAEVGVVSTSFIVEYVQFILKIIFFGRFHSSDVSWIAYLRAIRFLRALIVWKTRSKKFATAIRRLVSADRRRLEYGGYDLDLTYVNPRVIAMSWPSEGLEGLYRNNIDHVAQYLNEKHPDHYMIFNLCSERQYDESKFGYRVHRYKLDDHNPGALCLMVDFALDVDQFLKKDAQNVVIIHCKGGKGRTGTMICTHFLFSGFADSASSALSHFGNQRTSDEAKSFQGVESPSQERFVRYFGEIVKKARTERIPIALAPANKVKITKLVLHYVPIKWWDYSRLWLAVLQNPSEDQRLAVYVSNPTIKFVPNVGAVKHKHGKALMTEAEAEPGAAQCYSANMVGHLAGFPFAKSSILDPNSPRDIFSEYLKMPIASPNDCKKAAKILLEGIPQPSASPTNGGSFSPTAADDRDDGAETPIVTSSSNVASGKEVSGVLDRRVDIEFDCSQIPPVTADVVLKFFYDEDQPDTLHAPLQVWFNVNMEDSNAKIRWHRKDIDGPHKDPKFKKFPRDFSMSVDLAPVKE